jgi:TctA family transporter
MRDGNCRSGFDEIAVIIVAGITVAGITTVIIAAAIAAAMTTMVIVTMIHKIEYKDIKIYCIIFTIVTILYIDLRILTNTSHV